MLHYEETKYGFDYGAAKVTLQFSDDKKGTRLPRNKGY